LLDEHKLACSATYVGGHFWKGWTEEAERAVKIGLCCTNRLRKPFFPPSLPHLSKHLFLLPSNSPPYNSSHLPSPTSCSKSISSLLSHFSFLPNSLPLPYRQRFLQP
jgi:hypothetical protein